MSGLNGLTYVVPEECKNGERLKEFLLKHPEIKFVSLVGVDFTGNDTDERIPVEHFIGDLEGIMSGGIQTDGSSVNLPGIAELNDAKIDFIVDPHGKWFVDYTRDDTAEGVVGNIRIPAFFRHGSGYFCSRSLLKETLEYLGARINALLEKDKAFAASIGIQGEGVGKILFTLGTELEFWVRTPADSVSPEELSVTQMLKESYWKRTKGQVRTALEESLLLLGRYGYEVEMGHKEVGGVKGKVSADGSLHDVMEQLEIDWRYDNPLRAADNELYARILIKEVFRRKGLEVTFDAKPLEGVAGSGEHMHFGVMAETLSGRRINLFTAAETDEFLSSWGYGALMGLLKNWNGVNPFVTNSMDALNRLQPGYEAPICIVSSLGVAPDKPSRNRTVLVGVIRSDNPLSTRFELRAPNPHTNTYLAAAAVLLAMAEGMEYASGKTPAELRAELMKKAGDECKYLEKEREYVTERNIFSDFSKDERDALYGKTPATVWEVMENYDFGKWAFLEATPFNKKIRDSYRTAVLNKWLVEIRDKYLPQSLEKAVALRRSIDSENSCSERNWTEMEALRIRLFKNTAENKSMATAMEEALDRKDFGAASSMLPEMNRMLHRLTELYRVYRRNTRF